MKDVRSFVLSIRNRHFFAADFLILAVTPALALLVRLDSLDEFERYGGSLVLYTLIVLAIKLFIFWQTRMYSPFWAYASTDALRILARTFVFSFVAEFVLFYGFVHPLDLLPSALPRSLPLINTAFIMILVGATRVGVRMLFGLSGTKVGPDAKKPVLIAGAGAAGVAIAKELLMNPQVGLQPVAFLDDDPRLRRRRIHGVMVVGTLGSLETVVRDCHIEQVIIAMPSAPGKIVRDLVHACKEAGVASRTVPGLWEIASGHARVSEIREIQIEDLLRRGVIKTDPAEVAHLLQRKRVMVTGAGGSIGSELCRQIALAEPAELVLLGHGENSIFKVANELTDRLHGLSAPPVVADIRDRRRLQEIFRAHQPEVIFHAAAHKHVGLMQLNIPDAITNNVLGTRNLVELAEQYEAERFVMISSDKAVNPTNVMGATKRIAELVVHDMAVTTGRPFVSVRFGNVLGSRGSVVPIFKSQIASGGPVTVSDPRVTRYFMTIPEAVQLVLQAGAMGTGGEVYVLDMGEPIRILDLARDVIRLSGLVEGKDIDIVFTGLIPGEKLHEELFLESELPVRSGHEKIFVCNNGGKPAALVAMLKGTGVEGRGDMQGSEGDVILRQNVQELIEAVQLKNVQPIQDLIKRIVPEYEEQVTSGRWQVAGGGGTPPKADAPPAQRDGGRGFESVVEKRGQVQVRPTPPNPVEIKSSEDI